ncbi:Uncharacterized protein PBTT_08015 [Plasmodiophora brassicae]
MTLSSTIITAACFCIVLTDWECADNNACIVRSRFLIVLGMLCIATGIIALNVFFITAAAFPSAPVTTRYPMFLLMATAAAYKWILYGTYLELTERPGPPAFQRAFQIVLLLGHVAIGGPTVVGTLLWRSTTATTKTPDALDEMATFRHDDDLDAFDDEAHSLMVMTSG